MSRSGYNHIPVFLNGNVLKWITEHKYLDVTISGDFNNYLDIKQIKSLYAKGNTLVMT